VGKRGPVELWRVPLLFSSIPFLILGFAGAYAAYLRDTPSAPGPRLPSRFLLFFLLVPGAALAVALRRYLRRRLVRTEFFPDRVVVVREDAVVVPWAEIGGYDDGSADFVQLLRVDGRAPAELCVRTRSEEERVAVLALLDGRGLQRVAR
jgi:hypothetical protein